MSRTYRASGTEIHFNRQGKPSLRKRGVFTILRAMGIWEVFAYELRKEIFHCCVRQQAKGASYEKFFSEKPQKPKARS